MSATILKYLLKSYHALALVCALSVMSASAANASTMKLDFTGTNVTGSIYGLVDNAYQQTATQVDVTVNGTAYSFEGGREFAVQNGRVIYIRYNETTVQPSVIRLKLSTRRLELQQIITSGNKKYVQTLYKTNITIDEFPAPPAPVVPLPAGGLLLLSGLVGIAGLRRRKNSAA